MTGFKIIRSDGFHITFENGVTVSVIFGDGAYCNHIRSDGENVDAELAIWINNKQWITREFYPDIDDDVIGHVSPKEVLKALIWAEAYRS